MYDVIIVGARCAGAATAMLLARSGQRVLLVDRAHFPSDTMSTHILHPAGVDRLRRWGLLDQVRVSNCPPLQSYSLDIGPFALRGAPPPVNGTAESYCVRRTVLDSILVDAAVAAGAEVREGFAVQGLLEDAGTVTGIRGECGGRAISERGHMVVGADGLHSVVAKVVCPAVYNAVPPLTCIYYSYWSGVPSVGLEINLREGRSFGMVPTNDGLTCVIALWRNSEFHRFRADIERNLVETFDLAPALAERLRAGRREERMMGTGDLPNYLRTPYGSGWALVGDAAYHKDPITAEGITDAFRDAELLAVAIQDGMSSADAMAPALGEYERQRNQHAMPVYELTCQLATLDPPAPEMAQLLSALRDNQVETDRFFGVLAQTVPVQEFFDPVNVQRIDGVEVR